MEKYSAVFTDLDGTVLTKDKKITERTAKALKGLKKKGILWVVATARAENSFSSLEEIKYADALITLNGAKIKFNDRVISNGFASEDAIAIIKELQDKNFLIMLETSEGRFGNIAIPQWFTPKVDDLIEIAVKADVYKILVFGCDHQLSTVKEDKTQFAGVKEIEKTINDTFVSTGLEDAAYYSVAEGWLYQIMSKNATKWKGVELVLVKEGLSAGEAIYFGDDNDDIESISNCGMGVAMDNSIDKVKAAADVIAPSNDEDGVAQIIEEKCGM